MALIECPECKKEISSDAKKCPNCGYPIKKMLKKDSSSNKKITKKQIIIASSLLVILLFIGIYFIFFNNNPIIIKLSPNEEYAVTCTKKLINMMKSPDSFKLQDDMLIIVDNKSNKYLFIDYTASNSYGASIRSIAVFSGYIYLGDYDTSDKDDFNSNDKYLDFLWSRVLLSNWRLYGDKYENIDSYEIIDASKIGNQLNIQYNNK